MELNKLNSLVELFEICKTKLLMILLEWLKPKQIKVLILGIKLTKELEFVKTFE